jgi:hypothetical protein
MSDQSAIPLADAIETFVASLRQRSVPLNTIKSYSSQNLHQQLPRPQLRLHLDEAFRADVED